MYDLQHGVMPKLLDIFTGHKVGDTVELLDDTWKIEDIVL